jgi:hypothetical protein
VRLGDVGIVDALAVHDDWPSCVGQSCRGLRDTIVWSRILPGIDSERRAGLAESTA